MRFQEPFENALLYCARRYHAVSEFSCEMPMAVEADDRELFEKVARMANLAWPENVVHRRALFRQFLADIEYTVQEAGHRHAQLWLGSA